jgi:non-canonical (house-cleaning) NTP pyrophosphatase
LLPERIAAELRKGWELGPLIDELTGRSGVHQAGGAFGDLTQNRLTRGASFESAITCAFMKFINKEYYQ